MTSVNACHSKPKAPKHNPCDKRDFDKHLAKCKPEPKKAEAKCEHKKAEHKKPESGKLDRIERKLEKMDSKLEKILDKICDTSKKMDRLMDRCGGSDKGHRSNGSDKSHGSDKSNGSDRCGNAGSSNGSDNGIQGLLKQILALLDKLCGGNAGSKGGSAGGFGGNNTLGGMNSDLSKLLKQLQDYCGGGNNGGKAIGGSRGSDIGQLVDLLKKLIGQVDAKTGGNCGSGSIGGGHRGAGGSGRGDYNPGTERGIPPRDQQVPGRVYNPGTPGRGPDDLEKMPKVVDPKRPADCEKPKLEKWTTTDVCEGRATMDLGGKWRVDFDESSASFTVKDKEGNCVPMTRVWGDPHVWTENGQAFDFKKDSSFILPDGTKITVNTIPWNGDKNQFLSSRLTITKGDNAAVVTGLGGTDDGSNNLKIEIKDGQGRKLDKQVDDGQRFYGTKDGWVVKNETITVDQKIVDQLEAKKAAA